VRLHLLCIGGDDHHLRIPLLVALRERGFEVRAAGTGDGRLFADAGLIYHRFQFARLVNPRSDWVALSSITKLIKTLQPKLVQCFDTKLNLLVPFAARHFPGVQVVSTVNGLGGSIPPALQLL
jgi:Glycosyl transferase 4-like